MGNNIRINVNRGCGQSLGNMIDLLGGQIDFEGNWIEVEEVEDGVYEIVNDNMTVKNGEWLYDAVALGFSQWDDQVIDLDDGGSDESQCFGISSKLKYREVIMTTERIYAKNLPEVKEALSHVAFTAWCPGDI